MAYACMAIGLSYCFEYGPYIDELGGCGNVCLDGGKLPDVLAESWKTYQNILLSYNLITYQLPYKSH